MRTYFERIMKCSCGQIQRQTAINIPLDWIGMALDNVQKTDFLNRKDLGKEHKKCNSVNYTSWKLIGENLFKIHE